jgi:glycosyltransferase involved in cell wall biosynthesis
MLVSVCTVTYNRRPFIPFLIQCFQHQDYVGEVEWIIVDDGTDPIEDLVKDIPQVKYIKLDKKLPLGKKRNVMHEHCSGDILVYMDDDDYYPPTRISHAVQKLQESDRLCAGSSMIHVYFSHLHKILEFGPYGVNHATAGTFAFKKELLSTCSYEENETLAEEAHFLKGFTIPMVQLDPKHVILVVSHSHNTFDKKSILKQGKETEMMVADWIENPILYQFFKYDIQCLTPKREEFSIRIGNTVMKEDEILKTLNQQHQYILHLSKQIKAMKEEVLSGIEPELPDSKSGVITITP